MSNPNTSDEWEETHIKPGSRQRHSLSIHPPGMATHSQEETHNSKLLHDKKNGLDLISGTPAFKICM